MRKFERIIMISMLLILAVNLAMAGSMRNVTTSFWQTEGDYDSTLDGNTLDPTLATSISAPVGVHYDMDSTYMLNEYPISSSITYSGSTKYLKYYVPSNSFPEDDNNNPAYRIQSIVICPKPSNVLMDDNYILDTCGTADESGFYSCPNGCYGYFVNDKTAYGSSYFSTPRSSAQVFLQWNATAGSCPSDASLPGANTSYYVSYCIRKNNNLAYEPQGTFFNKFQDWYRTIFNIDLGHYVNNSADNGFSYKGIIYTQDVTFPYSPIAQNYISGTRWLKTSPSQGSCVVIPRNGNIQCVGAKLHTTPGVPNTTLKDFTDTLNTAGNGIIDTSEEDKFRAEMNTHFEFLYSFINIVSTIFSIIVLIFYIFSLGILGWLFGQFIPGLFKAMKENLKDAFWKPRWKI